MVINRDELIYLFRTCLSNGYYRHDIDHLTSLETISIVKSKKIHIDVKTIYSYSSDFKKINIDRRWVECGKQLLDDNFEMYSDEQIIEMLKSINKFKDLDSQRLINNLIFKKLLTNDKTII